MHSDIRWSGLAKHTLGITLLAITVLCWTGSSFLASTLFADNTYSKPYLITYFSTSLFSSYLIIRLLVRTLKKIFFSKAIESTSRSSSVAPSPESEREAFLPQAEGFSSTSSAQISTSSPGSADPPVRLDLRATIQLALEFGALWFIANFFQSKSLEYTSVGSSTILSSTSPIWTLLYGHFIGVERFSLKKLFGVFASLAGVVLIALGDLTGENDSLRGTFPHKNPTEVTLGDLLALSSAMLYGVYTTRFKKRVGDENRVDMLLFLGCVGVGNAIFLWPGFFLADWVGIEKFEWPETERVRQIILINAVISVFSDLTWAYAVVLTTPLVVTVGLSLSIPLSLLGQIIINAQGSGVASWVGAAIVLVAFIVVNREEQAEPEAAIARERQD